MRHVAGFTPKASVRDIQFELKAATWGECRRCIAVVDAARPAAVRRTGAAALLASLAAPRRGSRRDRRRVLPRQDRSRPGRLAARWRLRHLRAAGDAGARRKTRRHGAGREQGRQWRARRAGDASGASGRRADDHERQRRGRHPQPDAGAAGRDLGRHQAELARQTGVGAKAVVRRQGRALSIDRRGAASGPADLVGDRAGRRHQRRSGDDLLCARAEVENRHRLSRLRRHVACRHPQRSRFRPAVGGFGAATHRFDQAAGGVRRQALGPSARCADVDARPPRCPPTRPGS